MSKQHEALKLALDALDCIYSPLHVREINKVGAAMVAIREALAEPVQEPEGYFSVNDYGRWEENESEYGTPLYTAPPQRKPLTDNTLWEMWVESPSDVMRFARAIERAHGIGEA